MYFPILFLSLACATLGLAYQHGEIPSNVAVRSNGNGVIEFFHEADRREFEASQASKRQVTDPQSDTYPVTNDGTGVKPFTPADNDLAVAPAAAAAPVARSLGEEGLGGKKRQVAGVESDTYPVENDEGGVKPFKGVATVNV